MSNLAHQATQARKSILDLIYRAQSSHVGSNFSSVEILTVLFDRMDLKKDKFICSKGWIAAAVYYFLSQKGILDWNEVYERYCQEGETEYIGLIEPRGKFGLEAAGGAVGYGLSFGVGMALAKKLKGEEGRVYILMSDGEMDVGMVWESLLVAAKYKLDNLIAIVDCNGFQATGITKEVLNLGDLKNKLRLFNWCATSLDGHNIEQLQWALSKPNLHGPYIILAETVKGKGVKEFEGKLEWHYRNVSEDIYKQAVLELNVS